MCLNFDCTYLNFFKVFNLTHLRQAVLICQASSDIAQHFPRTQIFNIFTIRLRRDFEDQTFLLTPKIDVISYANQLSKSRSNPRSNMDSYKKNS